MSAYAVLAAAAASMAFWTEERQRQRDLCLMGWARSGEEPSTKVVAVLWYEDPESIFVRDARRQYTPDTFDDPWWRQLAVDDACICGHRHEGQCEHWGCRCPNPSPRPAE